MTCIECGNVNDQYNYLCKDCYLRSHPIIETRQRLKLNICKICGAPSVKPDLWYESPLESELEEFLIKALIELIDYKYKIKTLTDKKIEIISIDPKIFEINELNDIIEGKFSISGIPDLFLPEISIQEDFSVYLKYRKCHACQLISNGGAVVAKVQLRCDKRQIDEIKSELNSIFSNFIRAKNLQLVPSEEIQLKDGWDLSYFDTHGAEIIAQHFKDNFGAHIIKTKEIITYNRTKNKNVTRLVLSVRLPEYLIGDVVLFEDRPFQIVQINSTSTKLFDFTNKIIISKSNEIILSLNITNLYSRNQLTKFQVISLDTNLHSAQIMNLSTFEYLEISVDTVSYSIEEGFELFGFMWNDQVYIDQISPIKKIEQNLL